MSPAKAVRPKLLTLAAKKAKRKTQPKIARKGKQGWLLKPDRTQTVDAKFLAYLEDQRARLAQVLHDDNRREWSEREFNEATQRIIDRILFQRIHAQECHTGHQRYDY